MDPHDLQQTLRRLEPGGWLDAARRFSTSLRRPGPEGGRLMVVGTARFEPWHLTAHLDQQARFGGGSGPVPVLARWHVPDGAPPHLAVSADAVPRAGRGTTVLAAAPEGDDDDLLERLADARRGGAVVLALTPGGGELDHVAHDVLTTREPGFDLASHAVAAPLLPAPRRRRLWRAR